MKLTFKTSEISTEDSIFIEDSIKNSKHLSGKE